MKIKYILTIMFSAALLTSCSTIISSPYTAPRTLVTKNSVGTKVGVAQKKAILGFMFGNVDLSITTAAKKGNITKIATVDQETEAGFFTTTYRTKVTGE